ncbi:MAG: hypothetical protein EKK41_19235 [Hyphomicrobiales bacterium]|nr:MAG: hypothetical protein EKK41_19235 [Hyphomicrobiales bacterium]
MKIRKTIVVPALLALAVPVGFALAQGGPPGPMQGPGMGPGMGWGMGWGPARNMTPEMRERLNEGRIAMAKTALKLTDAQQKLWTPVEEQMRQSFAERQKTREDFRKEMEQRRAAAEKARADGQALPPRPSMAERLDRMSQFASQRADRLKAFNAAFKPFYESLSDEQKAVAEVVMREMGGGGRGHGHWRRWAMRDGGPMGMMRPDAGPGADAPPAPPAPPAKK